MKIEGRNAVGEAIKSGKTIDRLLVQKGLKDSAANKIIEDAKSRGIKIFFREKEALDRESREGRHQGFLAEITDFNYCELSDILAKAKEKGEPPFVLLLDGVEDPHNLGSILRVAECAGVHGVVIPRHRAVSVNETVIKVSAGAAAHVLVAKVTNINDAIDELKRQNVWVYAADMDGNGIYETNLKGATAFVIGGEGQGVKRLTKQKCDASVSIPMFGKVNSLNASVAAGIVAFEKLRQDRGT
ncbi:23S rRNA (guanosine(2251)-2'-O)-methyltransferase RlmB [Pumilibacter intestinalis]|uniref:23S rRNA (guanosine(2251)-2'-O)-methyltransferase RlmB n=1 Tax=Pumilibacter intestinalis TaxID=2941511 RepID=UPI00203F048B|nr:23S rRNA (guanosine(2251)-2'-O)-methyltransferase RlmB [Pumilibacter intestinalis]